MSPHPARSANAWFIWPRAASARNAMPTKRVAFTPTSTRSGIASIQALRRLGTSPAKSVKTTSPRMMSWARGTGAAGRSPWRRRRSRGSATPRRPRRRRQASGAREAWKRSSGHTRDMDVYTTIGGERGFPQRQRPPESAGLISLSPHAAGCAESFGAMPRTDDRRCGYADLHRERLPDPRRVHLPRHHIPQPGQPRRLRAHAVAQSRVRMLDDLEHAPRHLLGRDAGLERLTKSREHTLAGRVVRVKRPSGDRRSLTDRCVDESGLDQAHADAKRADLVPQRLGISLERELARRVEGAVGNGGIAGERADVDDLARARRPHPRKHRIHHAHGAEEIRLELRLGLIDTRLLCGAGDGIARVVDEHVQAPGLGHDLPDAGTDGLVRAHVERDHRHSLRLPALRLARRSKDGKPALGE